MSDNIISIDTSLIDAKENNRRDFSHVPKLAESIAEQGQHAPVIVRRQENGRYLLVAGESRTRACKLLGIQVKAIVRDDLDDRGAFMITLSENDTRQQTNDLEKASGYARALEEFGYSVEELARELGKRVDYIQRRLDLLQLDDNIQQLVASGNLGIVYASHMVGLNSAYQQKAIQILLRNESPRPAWFAEVCGELMQAQAQTSLFGLFGDEQDQGKLTSLLDDIETRHAPPPDPHDYEPAFNPADMLGSIKAEYAKWLKAADQWDRYGNTRKAKAAAALVKMLSGLRQALDTQYDATEEEAERIYRLLARRDSMTTKEVLQYGNMTSDEAAPILDQLVSSGRITRRRSGRGYRYAVAQ